MVHAIALLAPNATAWDGVPAAVRALIELFDAPRDGTDALPRTIMTPSHLNIPGCRWPMERCVL